MIEVELTKREKNAIGRAIFQTKKMVPHRWNETRSKKRLIRRQKATMDAEPACSAVHYVVNKSDEKERFRIGDTEELHAYRLIESRIEEVRMYAI